MLFFQVLHESEVCTSMIFSQGILHAAFGENYPIDSYFQSTEAQLGRALTICLNSYNGRKIRSSIFNIELLALYS